MKGEIKALEFWKRRQRCKTTGMGECFIHLQTTNDPSFVVSSGLL